MSHAAQALLLEYLHPDLDARILILEGSAGWLASQAARFSTEGKVLSLSRDFRQVRAAQTRLARSRVAGLV